jgi:hypothetical protein
VRWGEVEGVKEGYKLLRLDNVCSVVRPNLGMLYE